MGTTVTTDTRISRGGTGTGKKPGPGGDPPPDGGPGGKDWPPGWSRDDAIQPIKYRIGMWVGMASVLMLFIALTSAYIVRQIPPEVGTHPHDWTWIAMPSILWATTAVLLLSSLTVEAGRRSLRASNYDGFKRCALITTLLGFLFLVGQFVAWRQLSAQGIYVSTNPHSSFFYLLTALHSLHLLGGLIALSYVTVSAFRLRIGFRKRALVDVVALYWHFMDALWIYLFVLLFFWR